MNPNSKNPMGIESLNLSNVAERLQTKDKFEASRAEATVAMYRQFLQMVQENPQNIMVPNEDVDSAWHHHILDTQNYARDCQALFGQFLHHDPRASESDAFFEACEKTQALFNQKFGDGVFVERQAMCGGMLKDENGVELKPAMCGGMMKEEQGISLKSAMCGGMLKDESSLNLKPAVCNGEFKQDLNPAMCGGMLKDETSPQLKPAMCGGMLKDDASLTL